MIPDVFTYHIQGRVRSMSPQSLRSLATIAVRAMITMAHTTTLVPSLVPVVDIPQRLDLRNVSIADDLQARLSQ